MAKAPKEKKVQIFLNTTAEEKDLITYAAAIANVDVATFVLKTAIPAAEAVVTEAERVRLSTRDSLRVLEYLENPPEPNERLLDAARRLPPESRT